MTGTLIKLAALAASLAVVFRYGRREQGPGAVRTEASLPAAPGWECGDRIIRDQGVGALRIGANVDSIKKVCHVVRDVVRLAAEGMPAREIMVAFPPTQVEAEVVDGRVWRIAIASPEFVTPDSIRVGTSLRDLLRIGDAQGAIG